LRFKFAAKTPWKKKAAVKRDKPSNAAKFFLRGFSSKKSAGSS
jgi:hypothetical protein